MFTLLHDVRIGTRFLLRSPLFAAAAAGILALGISLGATLFAIVNGRRERHEPLLPASPEHLQENCRRDNC